MPCPSQMGVGQHAPCADAVVDLHGLGEMGVGLVVAPEDRGEQTEVVGNGTAPYGLSNSRSPNDEASTARTSPAAVAASPKRPQARLRNTSVLSQR